MRGIYPEHGARSVQNMHYLSKAFGLVKDAPAYAWLTETHPGGRWRRGTLLCELGRLAEPDLILQAAEWLCEERPTVKDGVAVIRRWRLSLSAP